MPISPDRAVERAGGAEMTEPNEQPTTTKRWNIPDGQMASLRGRVRDAMKNSGHDFKRFKQGAETLREIDAVTTKDPEPVADDHVTVNVNVVVTAAALTANQPATQTNSPWPIPPDALATALAELRHAAAHEPNKKRRAAAAKAIAEHDEAVRQKGLPQ